MIRKRVDSMLLKFALMLFSWAIVVSVVLYLWGIFVDKKYDKRKDDLK